ncbi:hypothetical protein RHODGE_RHODGE_03483 [Rhodoplanes serenus]|uniref:DOMON-like domain-containing protein n=2 Tax=Nitrobacteraceae TaxID=41294 RepID=A0A3S4CIV0_9BRAD|nr:hypothetical protein RHODGE_RHODGE_03483 [Rhodoplanes serenus]
MQFRCASDIRTLYSAAMLESLRRHSDSPPCAAARLAVEATRQDGGRLLLSYAVTGAIDALRLPPAGPPERRDGLWRHTCFEAFLGTVPGGPYVEINLSPSTAWAAYRFDRYRAGMRPLPGFSTPAIAVERGAETFTLRAELALGAVPALTTAATWRLALAAVVEDRDGISHWALAHPPGPPDFHHPDGATLTLAPGYAPVGAPSPATVQP